MKTNFNQFAITIILGSMAAISLGAPTKTITNLKAAYQGETTASSKYSQFAKAADKQGFASIARLFRATSRAESIHAANHKKVLDSLGVKVQAAAFDGKVGTTLQNLTASVEGERYENTTMYPQFLKDAKAEQASDAERSFGFARSTEQTHQSLYTQAIQSIKLKKPMPMVAYYVCPTCGETIAGKLPKDCPLCGTDGTLLVKVN